MAGAVGGLVGGLFGGGGVLGGLLGGSGLMGSLMGGASSILGGLASKFGIDDVVQGVMNLAGDSLQQGLNSIIDGLPIFGFMKDAAKNLVAQVIGQDQEAVSCECQDAVNEELGGHIEEAVNTILETIRDMMRESTEEATEGRDGEGEEGNWLMVLAEALGKQSGQHLKSMVDKGKELGAMDSEEKPEEYAELQAEFQAAGQIFKMSQEGISTMLKSIGEGLSAVARKQ